MHSHVLYNDRIVPATEAILRPGQLGLLAGWGVFTTLRIYEGVPFAFERHWARMNRDARLIHVPMPFDREQVRDKLIDLIERNQAQESTLRLCIVRSRGGIWEGPGSGAEADLVAFSTDLKGWHETTALTVREQGRHAASPFAGTKTLSWSHNLTMAEEAHQQGYGEVILLNERGEVAECTSANLFAVIGGECVTPPLSSGPLPGVTREVMLAELEPRVQERVLTLDDVLGAEEVFITSSTRELIPVDRITDRQRWAGPWPIMEALRQALREYVREYVRERREATTPSRL